MTAAIRVLYAEDNPQDADLTRAHFAAHAPEFAITIVATGRACLARLAEGEFDLLLLDYRLPDMEGIEVLRALIHRPKPVPAVLVTGVGDEELVVKALRLGAVNYVPKLGNYLDTLPDLLRDVLEDRRRQGESQGFLASTSARRILYVEHLPMDIELTLQHLVEAAPHLEVDVVRTCAEGLLRLAGQHAYDLALIDLRMPDQSALEFVREARRRRFALPPFIIISGKGDDAAAIAALKLGAADYIAKREGYLSQLVYTIDHAISHDRLNRLNAKLRLELADRRRAEDSLSEADARLGLAVAAANVGLWDWDLQTNQVLYSTEWKRQIGYQDHEIGNTFDEWKSRVHPDDLESVLREVQVSVAPPYPTHQSEFRFRHKDGSYRWILTQGSVRLDDHGQPTRMLGSHIDLTSKKQLETELRQSQKMEDFGRLAGGVAHDFNNLLTVISGYSDLLLAMLPAEDRAYGPVQAIHAAAGQAAALTRQLLAFSRRTILAPQVLDLNVSVTESCKMLRRLIPEDVVISTLLDPHLSRVKIDPGQIQQVLMNLAVNARDAMPTGGRLTIATRNLGPDRDHPSRPGEPRRVSLAMTDTGSGMPPEVRARIFEPFFTTKGVGRGTGLGLAMVQGIIEQSGGQIDVVSEPGLGTSFTIVFPAVDETVAEPVGHASVVSTDEHGTETVLLVEDAQNVRGLALLALQTAGYRVLTAGDGVEALRVVEEGRVAIDLLLTDVVMPAMGGRELADALRLRFPAMKVLYASGYTDDAVLRRGILHAEVAFLQKPYTPRTLLKRVREVLDRG